MLGRDQREVSANRFAAELLMPSIAVNQLITKHNVRDVASLAKRFNVSEAAMTFRLKNLGWL